MPSLCNYLNQFITTRLCENYASCKRANAQLSTTLAKSGYTDLFELNKQSYLLVVDYYSRYPEVIFHHGHFCEHCQCHEINFLLTWDTADCYK